MLTPDAWLQLAGLVGFTGVLAFLFAKVEIQIEGADGWAANLPTWRLEKHWLLDICFGGRPLTGYHAWVLPFILGAFHLPMAMGWTWSWALEARAFGALMLFWIAEDLLWFLLNPAWGWRRFNRAEVPWHKHWILRLPTDYWTFTIAAAILLWLGYRS